MSAILSDEEIREVKEDAALEVAAEMELKAVEDDLAMSPVEEVAAMELDDEGHGSGSEESRGVEEIMRDVDFPEGGEVDAVAAASVEDMLVDDGEERDIVGEEVENPVETEEEYERDIGLFQGSDGTVEHSMVSETLLTSSDPKFDDPSFIDGSIPSDSLNDTPPGSGVSTPLLDPVQEIDEGFVDGDTTPDGSEEQDLTSSEFDRKLQEGILFDGKEVDSEKAARKMAKLDLKLGLMKDQKEGTGPDEGYGSERGKGFVL